MGRLPAMCSLVLCREACCAASAFCAVAVGFHAPCGGHMHQPGEASTVSRHRQHSTSPANSLHAIANTFVHGSIHQITHLALMLPVPVFVTATPDAIRAEGQPQCTTVEAVFPLQVDLAPLVVQALHQATVVLASFTIFDHGLGWKPQRPCLGIQGCQSSWLHSL